MIYVVKIWHPAEAIRIKSLAWVDETGHLEGHHVVPKNWRVVAFRVRTVFRAPDARVVSSMPNFDAMLLARLLAETDKPEVVDVFDASEDEIARTNLIFRRWWRLDSLAP